MGQKFTQNKDGTENLDYTCDECKEPITHTTKYGMFCDKECGMEDAKKAAAEAATILQQLGFLLP